LKELSRFLRFCEAGKTGQVAEKALPVERFYLDLAREVGEETGIGKEQKGSEREKG